MYPILFQASGIVLPSWHFFYVVATCVGFYYFKQSLQSSWLAPKELRNLCILVYVSSYLGARIFSIFLEEDGLSLGLPNFLQELFLFGAMTFYGGFIFGLFFSYLYCFWKKLPFLYLLDKAIPAGMLSLAIGRLGCFLNGDDFGIAVPARVDGSFPFWAVTFPNHPVPIPRYPTQLLEAVGALLIFGYLYHLTKKPDLNIGKIAFSGIFGYAFIRFFLEFLRGDDRGILFYAFLSPSQWISLLLISMVLFSRSFKNYL